MPVQTQIQLRRGTAASWTSTNPTLGAGEIGFETDTGNFKIGTGAAAWASLPYNLNGGVSTSGGSTITVASGTTVPLTIQNNGTGNSFVVNDVASDTSPFVIDAAGLVGIGTTPSGAMLQVVNNTAANVGTIIKGATSQTGDLLQVQNSAGTVLVKINSAGQPNLGGYGALSAVTGNTTSYLTHQYLATSAEDSWGLANNYLRTDNTTGTVNSNILGTAEIQLLTAGAGSIVSGISFGTSTTVNTAPTERMRIDKSGNVGIGATTPATRLDVRGAINAYNPSDAAWDFNANDKLVSLRAGNDFFGSEQGLEFTTNSSGPTASIWAKGWGGDYNSGRLTFLTKSSGSLTQKMTITESGDVGIGTTTPAAKLDVNGSIKSDNLSSVNAILNSQFNVWQRGTTGAGASGVGSGFVADRWQGGRNGFVAGETISRQVTGDTTNLPFIQYCARIQRDASNTNTAKLNFVQSVETVNSIPFAGKTVTYSFYARAGANFSSTSNLLAAEFVTGTGTDQNLFSAGFSGQVIAISGSATLTTTWQRFAFTASLGSNITQIGASLAYTPTGTAGANDYFEVTGVQLELGNVATPYRSNQPTYQAELAACQRYYWRTTNPTAGQFPSPTNGVGIAESTTGIIVPLQCPVTMRKNPDTLDYSGLLITDSVNTPTISSIVLNSLGAQSPRIKFTVTGATQFRPYFIYLDGANTYLGLGAEL
jgi:hypothetical protein